MTTVDIAASNGIIHVVDKVIYPLPSGNVIETLAGVADFSTMMELVHQAGLEQDLASMSLPIFNLNLSPNLNNLNPHGKLYINFEENYERYTEWPRKNGTGYFPQYVDAITGISVWVTSPEKHTKISNFHYEPRSKKCLNLLSTRELSNKSQNCLYKVSNQFLIWSQTYLKIWDNFETWKR